MGGFCNYDDLDVRWPSTNDKATTRLTFKDHKEKKNARQMIKWSAVTQW